MRFRQFKIFFICTFFRCRLNVQNKPFVQPFFIFQSQYLRDNFFAVFHSGKTAKPVPHRSGYPDALNGIRFHLKVCYLVVIFVFPLSRFQTRVYLLRFQTISVLPAIMPGQANLSRNPEFPLCFFVSLTLSDSFTSSFVRQYRTAPCVASACKFSPYCIKIPCNTSVFLRHFYAIFRKICRRTCRTSSARYCLNFSAHTFLRKNGKKRFV